MFCSLRLHNANGVEIMSPKVVMLCACAISLRCKTELAVMFVVSTGGGGGSR